MRVIKEHKFISVCVAAAVIAAVLILWCVLRTTDEDIQQQAEAIKDAVSERALQCYVIENAYPESLAYLEENYGLQVNTRDFYITYSAFASNLPPQVTVTPKEAYED